MNNTYYHTVKPRSPSLGGMTRESGTELGERRDEVPLDTRHWIRMFYSSLNTGNGLPLGSIHELNIGVLREIIL